jgi:hypothetical protein
MVREGGLNKKYQKCLFYQRGIKSRLADNDRRYFQDKINTIIGSGRR